MHDCITRSGVSILDHLPPRSEIERRLRSTVAEREALIQLLAAIRSAERAAILDPDSPIARRASRLATHIALDGTPHITQDDLDQAAADEMVEVVDGR